MNYKLSVVDNMVFTRIVAIIFGILAIGIFGIFTFFGEPFELLIFQPVAEIPDDQFPYYVNLFLIFWVSFITSSVNGLLYVLGNHFHKVSLR